MLTHNLQALIRFFNIRIQERMQTLRCLSYRLAEIAYPFRWEIVP